MVLASVMVIVDWVEKMGSRTRIRLILHQWIRPEKPGYRPPICPVWLLHNEKYSSGCSSETYKFQRCALDQLVVNFYDIRWFGSYHCLTVHIDLYEKKYVCLFIFFPYFFFFESGYFRCIIKYVYRYIWIYISTFHFTDKIITIQYGSFK